MPRHPQRFDSVARLCRERGFKLLRRSSGGLPQPEHQILLGDTMGELLKFYGACDVAFVGGSLVPVGGHNMIEPAAWGIPVACGPHLHNFATVAELLSRAGAMAVVEDAEQLADELEGWLNSDGERHSAGARGREVAEENSGALQRLLDEIEGVAAGR
ncbi:3-deoxy-D-manno-octulosonic acid transferase [Microbulbifer taiwanensis]|uniref:3-deoxy-D-manno-octulosonic acid transferase n=1 Tax=Microbulbifer taiwanensis TaxID=986746 RepID=UPI0036075858